MKDEPKRNDVSKNPAAGGRERALKHTRGLQPRSGFGSCRETHPQANHRIHFSKRFKNEKQLRVQRCNHSGTGVVLVRNEVVAAAPGSGGQRELRKSFVEHRSSPERVRRSPPMIARDDEPGGNPEHPRSTTDVEEQVASFNE